MINIYRIYPVFNLLNVFKIYLKKFVILIFCYYIQDNHQNVMKDRVKLNTKTGKCYPQRKIFGLWFNYYVNGNIFTGDTYYCYSTESGLRYIELQKHYKKENEISYHYLDTANDIKYKNYRIVYVKKNGNIKLIAQRKYLFFWFTIHGNLRNFENGWNMIQNKHTPKIQYFYPERTRKERIQSLK